MNDEELKIANAKAVGWEWHHSQAGGCYVSPDKRNTVRRWQDLPDYLNDLKAIGELKAELERVKKQAAAMREALLQVCDAEVSHSNALANCCNIPSAQSEHDAQIAAMRMKAAQSLATQALADNAGANYVSKEQVKPLVTALKILWADGQFLNPEVLATFSEGASLVAANLRKQTEIALAYARTLGL